MAMSIEDRRTADWQLSAASLGNQLQYLFDRRLRDYKLEELGQFQIITDVIGGFWYTTDLTCFHGEGRRVCWRSTAVFIACCRMCIPKRERIDRITTMRRF